MRVRHARLVAMRVLNIMPVARRAGNRFLDLDSCGHFDLDLLHRRLHLNDFMVFLHWHVYSEILHYDDRNLTLSFHFDLNRHVDPLHGRFLQRDLLCSVDVVDFGTIVGLIEHGYLRHVNFDFLDDQRRHFNDFVDHVDLGNFASDRINVILRYLNLFGGYDDLGLSRRDHRRGAGTLRVAAGAVRLAITVTVKF